MAIMLYTLLEEAILFAVQKHAGQRDKTFRAYILHPLRILSKIQPDPGMSEAAFIKAQILSVLHDVHEDCDVSLDEIQRHFGLEIREAVNAISRRKGESYPKYLKRVKGNALALLVKKWDIQDNMSPDRNGPHCPISTEKWAVKLVEKYRRALNYLNDFTEEF